MSETEINKDASGCKNAGGNVVTVVNEETSKVEANILPQKKAERVDRMD